MTEFKTLNSKGNLRGFAMLGKKHTKKTKRKISKSRIKYLKNNPHPKGMLGKKHSKESRKKTSNSMNKIKQEISKRMKDLWQNKEYQDKISKARLKTLANKEWKEKWIKATLKGLMKRPTSFEQKIIDLNNKHNLPFRYTGDGRLIINYVNPDFICINHKLIIETYFSFWHPKNYRKIRTKRFSKFGYQTLFLDENDLCCKDWEERCLNKIKKFLKNG